ncbi:Xylitol dehydrogenase [Balamuthia mandrillaris]
MEQGSSSGDTWPKPASCETSTNAFGRFKGKTVLITGGAGNFGRACGLRFAREGANVVLLDLVEKPLQEALADVKAVIKEGEGEGSQDALAITCDVTDAQGVKEAVQRAVERFGAIDMCFNNAGYQGLFVKTQQYPEEDFQKVININVTGVFNVLKAVSVHMTDTGKGGSIVNTASMAGVTGPPNMLAYSTSKAAVLGMTKTAARDLAPSNIRVNAISPAFIGPGFMWTRQCELQAKAASQYYDADPQVVARQMVESVPMRRCGSVEEVIGTVAFLLSDDASYLTGINVEITGGI